MLVCHPFEEKKRAYITPSRVKELLQLTWNGSNAEYKARQQLLPTPSLSERRQHCLQELAALRQDHTRHVNPTPFKVSVSEKLFQYTHKLWQENVSVPDL
jgi:nicotinate phosphoribosyltransferase